ncbi:MAG: PKD domain-containing protein [bacterium]|nr:PKD domain-containing protein [bacterium]
MKHLFLLTLLLASVFAIGPATAGTNDTVSGWAWADTVGWVSFNCTNVTGECDRSNYGVTIDPDTGKFSGYAWSDNIGWVSFTRDATMGTPPAAPFNGSENYSALWNKTTNAVTGWAKILSMGNGGWLQFRSAAIDPATARISGWMWNGNSDGTGIGWVELRSVQVAQSVVNLPPTIPIITEINNTAVTDGTIIDTGKTELATIESVTALQPKFSWSPFVDPNGTSDVQQAYQIAVEELVNGTWTTLYTSDPIENSGNAFLYSGIIPALRYGTTYRWKVRVQDNAGVWSPYAEPVVFTTPSQALPQLSEIAPAGVADTGQTVQLNGAVIVPEGTTVTAWQWNFGDGTTLEGQQQYDTITGSPTGTNYIAPNHTYTADGTYTVTLTVTDSAGYTTTRQMTLAVQKNVPLPVWRRIIPF